MFAIVRDGQIVQTANNPRDFFPSTLFPASGPSQEFLQENDVYEVVSQPREDERFYWVTPGSPVLQVIDGVPTMTFVNTPKDLDVLKMQWVAQAKEDANRSLAATDWYVIRKAERGVDIPQDVIDERTAIVDACNQKEDDITAAETVEGLKAVLFPVVEAPPVIEEVVIQPVVQQEPTDVVEEVSITSGNIESQSVSNVETVVGSSTDDIITI